MSGLQVEYDDGSKSDIFGQTIMDRRQTFKWASGEQFTELQTWQNKANDGLARIKFTVNGQGHEYASETRKGDKETGHLMHSGILVAVRGRTSEFVRTLEFKFMTAKTKKVNIIELKFPEDSKSWNEQRK
jgi:hypothetical protein